MCSGALEEGPTVCLGRWQGGLFQVQGHQKATVGPPRMANRQRDQCRSLCPWLSPGLSLGLDQPVFHLAGFTKAGCRFQLYEDLNAAWYLKAQRPRRGEQNTSLYTVLFTKNQMKMELQGAWAHTSLAEAGRPPRCWS